MDAALGDAAIPVNSSASFAWTRQPLRVHVVSSALDDQASIVYRYRLVGLEEEWASSKSQDLHYTSLPDGKYRLEVYAEDTNRGVRSPLTVIAFQMRPPWWRSTAFEILLAVFLLALGYAILRFRERHLTARQAELESLVRARTEELELEKTQLLEAREALRFQATRDSLTGLLNHAAIRDSLKREMDRARRDASPLTVVMIDVDNFKLINDTEGHMAGDGVLREVGHRLTGSIRPYDAVGRYGGDEFLLVMPNFDANEDRARLALIHRTVCGEPIAISTGHADISCSFGVSILSGEDSASVEQLLDSADKALYDAKNSGRNCIVFYAPS